MERLRWHAEDGTGTPKKTLGIPGSALSTSKTLKAVGVQNTSYSLSVRDPLLKTVQNGQTSNTQHSKQMRLAAIY